MTLQLSIFSVLISNIVNINGHNSQKIKSFEILSNDKAVLEFWDKQKNVKTTTIALFRKTKQYQNFYSCKMASFYLSKSSLISFTVW